MSTARGPGGRFAPKPIEELSPAYARRRLTNLAKGRTLSEARGHATRAAPAWKTAELAGSPKYDKALKVLGRVRDGESLTKASKAYGISPDTVRRYAGSAMERDARGRWTAKPTDRLYRRMQFLVSGKRVTVEPANSREAAKIGRYWNAVDHFLATGDDRPLRKFRRMTLQTRQKTKLQFVTDLDTLEQLGLAGETSFEDMYES